MAFEAYLEIKTIKSKVTAIGSNPARRELVLGFEDGSVDTYDHKTGELIHHCYKHKGWVTVLSAFPAAGVFFSAGNDSTLITYNRIGSVVDKLNIGSVIYAICYHPRLKQVIFGIAEGIQIHEYELNPANDQIVRSVPLSKVWQHNDITTGVLMLDKLYSVGFDGQMIIYDYSSTKTPKVAKKFAAHDAGITCIIAQKNPVDNSEWLMTGSFDKTAKVWSLDGQLLSKFTDFTSAVTGLTFVNSTKTVWIAAGHHYADVYDPKGGEKVSRFIDTFLNADEKLGDNDKNRPNYCLISLRYLPDMNIVVGSTNTKQVNAWTYKKTGCVSCLKVKSPVESVCYTSKAPILMFTGDAEGNVFKWEQMQSNRIMYSDDRLLKLDGKQDLSEYLVSSISLGETKSTPTGKESSKTVKDKGREGDQDEGTTDNDNAEKKLTIDPKEATPMKRIKSVDERLPACYVRTRSAAKIAERERGIGGYVSQYVHLENMHEPQSLKAITKTATGKSILRIIFVEKLDLIVASSEDHNIYVWGYDSEAMQALKTLKEKGVLESNEAEDGETANRVAGFVIRKILNEHTEPVTSLAVVDDPDLMGQVFLLSAGWDRRICLWKLNDFSLFDVYSDPNATNVDAGGTASTGYIHNMDYSPPLKCFAYAAGSDMCVYVREFSTTGSHMKLVYQLKAGVDSEVTCIKWNFVTNEWVTGMDNGEFRIWGMDGQLRQAINTRGSIHTIAIDHVQRALLIGNQDALKVFEMDEYTCVQTNDRHTDVIREVIFIPERKQYVTVSLDCTMRIWNAWSRDSLQKKETNDDPQSKLSDRIWEDIRECMKNPIDVEDANSIIDKYFQNRYDPSRFSIHDDQQGQQPTRQVSFVD